MPCASFTFAPLLPVLQVALLGLVYLIFSSALDIVYNVSQTIEVTREVTIEVTIEATIEVTIEVTREVKAPKTPTQWSYMRAQ